MRLRSPAEHEMELIPQGLTPIQPFPVEGKGSDPPLDGEDTGGVHCHAHFHRRSRRARSKKLKIRISEFFVSFVRFAVRSPFFRCPLGIDSKVSCSHINGNGY